MNKQRKGGQIEWTQVYDRVGYTWNVVSGCQHDCKWRMPDGSIAQCYAKSIAEGVAQKAYPHGFEHHYWNPQRLQEPLKLETPAGIFLDSMSDLMGRWVTDDQIQQVLDVCRDASQHIFFLLTKNAPRLPKYDFPKNVWVGASSPPDFYRGKRLSQPSKDAMLKVALESLGRTNATVKWMSFEPLSDDYSDIVERYPVLNWAVIGAASNGRTHIPPYTDDFNAMMRVLDAQQVAVFFKGNLRSLPEADQHWREDFPSKAFAGIS